MRYTSGFAILLGIGALIAIRNEGPAPPSAPTCNNARGPEVRVKGIQKRASVIETGRTKVRKTPNHLTGKSSASLADGWRQRIDSCTDGGQRRMSISDAMTDLCSQDPLEAVRFAETLDADDGRNVAIIQGLAALAGSGAVQDALSHAETMIPAEDLPIARAQIAMKWSETDPESAMAWTATVSDPLERDSLAESIAAKWAQTQPEKALHWLANASDVPAWKEIMISVSSEWARIAPEAALSWAKQQGAESPQGPDLEQTVMLAWSEEDPVPASENMIMQPHAIQLAVAGRVATHLVLLNPDLVARWVDRIQYPDVREQAEAALLSHTH